MPRDSVAVTALAMNTGNADAAGTTITVANGQNIACGATKGQKLLVRVTLTVTNSTLAVTFRKGANPPGQTSGLGDLSASIVGANPGPVSAWFVLETARFLQTDGTINVDAAAGFAGTVSAFALPAGAG